MRFSMSVVKVEIKPHEAQKAITAFTENRLAEDIAALHLGGLSTRTLSLMATRILGIDICPKTVTNSLASIGDGAEKWLRRPIEKKYWALMIDGTNFRVKRRGSTEKEPSLVVV